jgi:hypothetical protein
MDTRAPCLEELEQLPTPAVTEDALASSSLLWTLLGEADLGAFGGLFRRGGRPLGRLRGIESVAARDREEPVVDCDRDE